MLYFLSKNYHKSKIRSFNIVSFNKNIQYFGPNFNFFSDCHILKFLEVNVNQQIKNLHLKSRKNHIKVKENITYFTLVWFCNNKMISPSVKFIFGTTSISELYISISVHFTSISAHVRAMLLQRLQSMLG